jgi:hypothetical protein
MILICLGQLMRPDERNAFPPAAVASVLSRQRLIVETIGAALFGCLWVVGNRIFCHGQLSPAASVEKAISA